MINGFNGNAHAIRESNLHLKSSKSELRNTSKTTKLFGTPSSSHLKSREYKRPANAVMTSKAKYLNSH